MVDYKIKSSPLKGGMSIPPSKSHTLRAILFGMMGHGTTYVHHYLHSPDTEAMIAACRLFGSHITVHPSTLEIEGVQGRPTPCEDIIHAGNSGIVLRFCAGIGALGYHPVVITGDYSVRHQRPMHTLLDGLSQLGALALSMRGNGYAPVIIQGPITKRQATLEGSDSQPISALLIMASFLQGDTELYVRNPGEKPWVAMTLDWLGKLHIPYEHDNYSYYKVKGSAIYQGFTYHVPGDFSSCAFPIAAALVTASEIFLQNLDMNDIQGDKVLIDLFQQMGANITVDHENKTLHVKKTSRLTGICVDLNPCIDAITILAVVACFADSTTHIYNASIAKQKECNRLACITQELRKMNANITETDDGLIIAPSSLKGAFLHSHHDHRMAMSLAVAALGAEGESTISSIECIAKTFPNFLEHFQHLGANIEKIS